MGQQAKPGRRPKTNQRMSFVGQLSDFLRRHTSWFLVAGLALLLLQDIFGTHGVLAMRRTQKQAAEIRKEIDRLNQENRQLQNCVEGLRADPTSVERIAREDMGLARPGEYVFKIPSKSAGAASSPCPAVGPERNR